MSRFGNTLFGTSPFIRWSLSPFLLGFALIMPLVLGEWDFLKIAIIAGLEILCFAVLLGFWAPERVGHAAFRIACLIVFLGYAAYLTAELLSGKPLLIPRSRAESSAVNAALGLVIIGLPALRYAIRGRFGSQDISHKTEEQSNNADDE